MLGTAGLKAVVTPAEFPVMIPYSTADCPCMTTAPVKMRTNKAALWRRVHRDISTSWTNKVGDGSNDIPQHDEQQPISPAAACTVARSYEISLRRLNHLRSPPRAPQ